MEYFDIVDERDKVIGTASRLQCHRSPNLIHRSVHIFVFNSQKQLFVQKRGENTDMHPNLLCSSAAGHVTAGDDYGKTAFRELKEELGIEPEMVVPVFEIKLNDGKQTEFVTLFFCYHNGKVEPNTKELGGGEFRNIKDIKENIEANGDEFTPFFKEVFLKYYNELWIPNGNGEDEESGH